MSANIDPLTPAKRAHAEAVARRPSFRFPCPDDPDHSAPRYTRRRRSYPIKDDLLVSNTDI